MHSFVPQEGRSSQNTFLYECQAAAQKTKLLSITTQSPVYRTAQRTQQLRTTQNQCLGPHPVLPFAPQWYILLPSVTSHFKNSLPRSEKTYSFVKENCPFLNHQSKSSNFKTGVGFFFLEVIQCPVVTELWVKPIWIWIHQQTVWSASVYEASWEICMQVRKQVRTGHGPTDWFQIGVRQGCILSPCLFNLYADYTMRNAGLEEAQAFFSRSTIWNQDCREKYH